VAKSIAPEIARGRLGAAQSDVPGSAIKMRHPGAAAMPLDKAATGPAIKK
jgi:hypothetical protein